MVIAVWGERSKCAWSALFPIVDAEVASEVCPLFFRVVTAATRFRGSSSSSVRARRWGERAGQLARVRSDGVRATMFGGDGMQRIAMFNGLLGCLTAALGPFGHIVRRVARGIPIKLRTARYTSPFRPEMKAWFLIRVARRQYPDILPTIPSCRQPRVQRFLR